MVDAARIETHLREHTRFRECHFVASCPSTQDLAADQPPDSRRPAADALFWADHQTRGRGRQRREWHDEPGADLAVTFRFTARLPQPLALPAATPVVVAEACEAVTDRALRIKWPNDVFLDGRKVAGVLIDAGVGGPDTYLVGVGINCNRVRFPPDLEPIATSLAVATGHTIDRETLLIDLAQRLDRMLVALQAQETEQLEQVFRRRLGLMGKAVEVQANETLRGVLTGLDFTSLELDRRTTLPLGVVRGIRGAAP